MPVSMQVPVQPDYTRMGQLKRLLNPRWTRTRKPMQHGTVSGYVNHQCRCEECRRAIREFRLKANADRPGIPTHLHGRPSTYVNLGCRCEPCRKANTARCAEASREYKRRVKAAEKRCTCGKPVPAPRSKYCSAKCGKQQAQANWERANKAHRQEYGRTRHLALIEQRQGGRA